MLEQDPSEARSAACANPCDLSLLEQPSFLLSTAQACSGDLGMRCERQRCSVMENQLRCATRHPCRQWSWDNKQRKRGFPTLSSRKATWAPVLCYPGQLLSSCHL